MCGWVKLFASFVSFVFLLYTITDELFIPQDMVEVKFELAMSGTPKTIAYTDLKRTRKQVLDILHKHFHEVKFQVITWTIENNMYRYYIYCLGNYEDIYFSDIIFSWCVNNSDCISYTVSKFK